MVTYNLELMTRLTFGLDSLQVRKYRVLLDLTAIKSKSAVFSDLMVLVKSENALYLWTWEWKKCKSYNKIIEENKMTIYIILSFKIDFWKGEIQIIIVLGVLKVV